MPPDFAASAVSTRWLRIVAASVATVAAAVVFLGITTRQSTDARLRGLTEAQAMPVVAVKTPDLHDRTTVIDLPGRLEALSQAQLYARVSGYIKSWTADMGAPVKAGQVLAEIEAPDLDQQIMQAEADVASAKANAGLSSATLQRGQSLIKTGAVSTQDLDQRSADFANKQGIVKSVQANLDRLRVLEQYKHIVAPFDGLVTSRTTDIGALINAGAGGQPALFVISDVRRLRVYVNVPQNYVPSVTIGTHAEIVVPEHPGKTFPATVTASAQAVDVASGTTRMQLIVDNPDGELMTGAYANVRLELHRPELAINVSASALMFDQNGMYVATVGSDDRVSLKPVTIARDLGKEVEIAAGLSADDRVIESPPDGIEAGDRVRIAGTPDAPVGPKAVAARRGQDSPEAKPIFRR
jgi:RND family efflux transporter MFP subunit